MFLIAFSYTKANQEWGRAVYSSWQSFWKLNSWRTKLWSSIALCQSHSKYARKEQRREEKQSEENRGQQLQSSLALLEYFPKFIFYILYTISKLRKSTIQCFKRYVIRSWNEGVIAIASRSLQAEGRFLHGCEISLLLWEFRSHFVQCTGVLLKLPDSCDRHFWIFFFRYFCINFHSSPCNPPIIGFLSY